MRESTSPMSSMAFVATLVLLSLVAPSTSARHGAYGASLPSANLAGRRDASQPRYLAFAQATPGRHGSQTRRWTSSSGRSVQNANRECLPGSAECLKALTLVRGGGADNEPSLSTLFLRVFMPKFGRESDAKEGELDLEGGGLMRRLGRFVSRVFGGSGGSSKSADSKGETAKKKGTPKGKGATASHLEQTYRPGNANYRIQKELKDFMANPPDNCKVSVGKNIRVWIITISGAEGTIYAGEKFRLRVAFPEDYPTKPPAVYFLQSPPPPKHQHIYTNGDICLSLLSSRDWKPNLTVMSLALSILSMLSSAKEKRIPEDNAAHAEARPGQAQQWIYHDDLC